MSRLRLRVHFNKGREGIALDKLERIVEEMRKFLASVSNDIELLEPNGWLGTQFKTGSLEFISTYSHDVDNLKLDRFNNAIVALGRSEFPPSLDESTANQFFDLATLLDAEEKADMAVFSDNDLPISFEVSRDTATKAQSWEILPFREALGAIQGTIHSLHNGSKPPYFTLRELSTRHLVRCLYRPEDYPTLLEALQHSEQQVIHVRGTVTTNTRRREIYEVKVKQLILAETYGYEDVERFLKKRTP
jgi:hypothetical protein